MSNTTSSRIDWNNLSEHQVIVRLAREARLAGSWEAAREMAVANLEPDEVDDLLRKARNWADGQRTW